MKELILSAVALAEEVLISYKGYTFSVKNSGVGQYGFERKVFIFLIDKELKRTTFKTVSVLRLFSGDKIEATAISEQALITKDTTFAESLETAKEYITKYVDFTTS